MIFDWLIYLIVVLGVGITLGGCFCCQVCSYCDDAMATLSFDVVTNADQCNGNGCDNLTGTYVLDMDETCCVSYAGDPETCSTDDCDSCVATDAGGGIACCEVGQLCENYAPAQLGDPGCTGNTAYDNCTTTAGCSGNTDPAVSDTACASNPALCEDYFGPDDPGYSCERTVTCDPDCSCNDLILGIDACITDDGTKVRLTGSISDGHRTYTFDEELGDLPTIDCLGIIDALALTLTETPNGAAFQLCTLVSVTVTGAEA